MKIRLDSSKFAGIDIHFLIGKVMVLMEQLANIEDDDQAKFCQTRDEAKELIKDFNTSKLPKAK